MNGLQPVMGYSTWNRENQKHTLCHFQIFEVHSSGGEYRGKTGSTWTKLSTYFLLVISEWKKLIHEIISSLSEDAVKQTDYSLEYERKESSIGYSTELWPVVGTAVPPSQSPQFR